MRAQEGTDGRIAVRKQLVERLKGFEVLSTMRERTPIPRELVVQLPKLKLILTTGMKNRSFDMEACKERFISLPPLDLVSVAWL